MSDDNHVYVLDSTLLDDKSQLTCAGYRNSVVENGSQIVGLGTPERYLTLECDDSCMNGEYVRLNTVQWFEMKGYRFPPRSSSSSCLQPGTYYLVQRAMANEFTDFCTRFNGQIKFTLTEVNEQIYGKIIATFLFDIQQLAVRRDE